MILCIVIAMDFPVKVLVISGSMGSGKTTVLGEASDILTASNIAHVALDLDVLGIAHLPDGAGDDLMMQNLALVWTNYARAGARSILIAEPIENVLTLGRLREAIPRADIIVCRLRASLETMQQRIRLREPGMLQEKRVARVAELEASLDSSGVEDFSVDNDGRSITEVAREVLVRAGWL